LKKFKQTYITLILFTVLFATGCHLESQAKLWDYLAFQQLHVALLEERAHFYMNAFNYDAAIDDMTVAIALQPQNPALYTRRGQMIMLLYEWDRAIADYDSAIELDSQYAPAYFHRAVAHYSIAERVDRQQILADFKQYLMLAPDGDYADQAISYIKNIELEIQALGG